jgi:hypothetical protein
VTALPPVDVDGKPMNMLRTVYCVYPIRGKTRPILKIPNVWVSSCHSAIVKENVGAPAGRWQSKPCFGPGSRGCPFLVRLGFARPQLYSIANNVGSSGPSLGKIGSDRPSPKLCATPSPLDAQQHTATIFLFTGSLSWTGMCPRRPQTHYCTVLAAYVPKPV